MTVQANHNPRWQHLIGWLLGLTGVIIFSASLPATKLALIDFEPWFITTARALIATIAALPLIYFAPKPQGREWRDLALSGLCLIFAFPGFMALGMQTVDAGHGGVVVGILPLFTAVAATWLAGERPSWAFWFWAIAGAAAVVIFTIDFAHFSISPGDLWLLLSTVCCAIGYAISGKLARRLPGWAVIAWSLLIYLPVNLLCSVWQWQSNYIEASMVAWGGLFYVGLFSMLAGFFAWNAGLAIGGVARISQIQLTQTFFTILIAWFVLAEPFEFKTIIFALIVALTVLFGRRAKIVRRNP